jgi:hypothetical protein
MEMDAGLAGSRVADERGSTRMERPAAWPKARLVDDRFKDYLAR